MFAKTYPKVSLQSRLTQESYDAKFGADECARNNYGVTLNEKFNFVVCPNQIFCYTLF